MTPPARRPPRPAARANPDCPTCHGTGRFVTLGKAHELEVPCPRCLRASTVRAIPQERSPHIRSF